MSEKALEAIKGAILMEVRGEAFYRSVVEKSESPAIREVFQTMAEEELGHRRMLEKHYVSLKRDGVLAGPPPGDTAAGVEPEILGAKLTGEISAAGFEAAAISAAMGLEQEAVRVYGERAEQAEDPLERELFIWLADWEKTHLTFLASMDKALMEDIWFDNGFWPEI